MGFEVNFIYHEKVDGKYNTDERKELRKKIGGPTDDTPLEKLAGAIMTQLARRDIWVVDVEVFEFTKKQITFKESNDGNGIVIKGRKFNMGGIPVEEIGVEQAPAAPVLPEGMHPHELIARQQGVPAIHQPPAPNVNLAPVNQRPQMFVRFDPEYPLLVEAKKKSLRFTEGKRYPVFKSEQVGVFPAVYTAYTMKDDLGREVRVHAKYFSAANEVRLVGDGEVMEGGGFSDNHREDGPRLSFESEYVDEMPELRRGGGGPKLSFESQTPDEMPDLRPGRQIAPIRPQRSQANIMDDFGDGMTKMPELRPGRKLG